MRPWGAAILPEQCSSLGHVGLSAQPYDTGKALYIFSFTK